MSTTVATLNAVITADNSGFVRAMDSVRGSIAGTEASTSSLGQTMTKVGATMTAAITLPLLGIGAAAVKSASAFDSSMHNINSIVHMSATEMDELAKKTLEFGSTSREGPQKVADALYQIYSAGLSGEKAFDLMKVSTMTAEAGLADLDATTRAMTATMQAYSNQNITSAEASNIWTKMVQVGVGSMDEFVSGAQRVLPSGAALGVTFQDLGANLAFMSQMGGGATQAETAVSMAMTNLMKPTKAMSAAFQKLGVTDANQLIQKFGSLEGAVVALKGATSSNVDFAKMFSKGGLQYVTALTNNLDAAKKSIADFGVGLDDATKSAWDEQMQSYASQSDHFNSAISALSITIGQQLLPILTQLIEAGTQFLLGLMKTNPEVLKWAVAFGIAAAAIGPLLLIIPMLFNPITLLLGVVAALGLAFSTNFLGIRDIVLGVVNTVSGILAPFITNIQALWDVVTGKGMSMTQAYALENFAGGLSGIAQDIQNKVSGLSTTKSVKISIPIKAGMTLSDLYYNSDYSKDLQASMSYDEFVKQAKTQIKGGDPRWLQVGSTLTFGLPVDAQVETTGRPVIFKTGTNWNFQLLKDKIQEQYDFVFKGKPIITDDGKDAQSLPVLNVLRLAVLAVSGVLANWKETFTNSLKDIGDGITGFVTNLTKGVDWTTMQQIAAKIMIVMTVLWMVFSTVIQGLIQVAAKIVGSALPVVGTILSDFINTIAHAVNGNNTVGADLLKIAIDMVAGINKFVNDMTGTSGTFAEKFANLSGAITTAIQLVISALQGAARDLKLGLNTFLIDVLTKMASVDQALATAGLIPQLQVDGVNVLLTNLTIDTDAGNFAKGIETALTNGGGGMGSIVIDGKDLQTTIALGGAKQIADQLTVQGREGLLAAIRTAVTNGDKDGILSVAIPIAVAGGFDLSGIDFSKLGPDVSKALMTALGQGTGVVGATPVGSLMDTSATGKAIIDGLSKGITDNTAGLYTVAQDTTQTMLNKINETAGVHSPSTMTAETGGFLVTGLILGIATKTPLLIIASNLMALIGVKLPLTIALSAAAGATIGSTFMGGLAGAISAGNPALQTAVNGVIGMFNTLHDVVLRTGNTLADQLGAILEKLSNQLAALKKAIADAAGIAVPTGPATPTKGVSEGGGGAVTDQKGSTGPKVNLGTSGSLGILTGSGIGTPASVSQASTTNQNTVVVNGVTDVDKMLFELKRRGITLT